MTTSDILKILRKAGKPISMQHLYRTFATLGIRHMGVKQRPQQYPPEAAEMIIVHFGLAGAGACPPANGVSSPHSRSVHLLTPGELRHYRQKWLASLPTIPRKQPKTKATK